MNATQKGWATNIAGLVIIWAATKGINLPPDTAAILSSTLGSIGLAINQFLIKKAQKESPPAPQADPALLKNQAGFFTPQFASVVCILAFALIALPGCATFGKNVDQSKLIVQVATMKVIEADQSHTKERAAKIREVASDGKTFLDGANVSVPLLSSAINARLAGIDIAPSDRVLAAALVDAVAAELNARVGSGLLSPEQKYSVSQVLGWVIDATSFYQ